MKNEELKQEMDGWVKDMQKKQKIINEKIDHNYCIIQELKEDYQELADEYKLLRLNVFLLLKPALEKEKWQNKKKE